MNTLNTKKFVWGEVKTIYTTEVEESRCWAEYRKPRNERNPHLIVLATY